MNRKIIEKILDALNKPQVDVSYVRGILETLLETLPEEKSKVNPESVNIVPLLYDTTGTPLPSNPIIMSEAIKMEQEAKVKMKSVENIIDKSVSME